MNLSILKELRKAKKIKLYELATTLKVSAALLSKIENNKGMKCLNLLEGICKELDCELMIIHKRLCN